MKLKYFGTAAAEGWPGLFCDCNACRRARAAGGRNIRTRSQAIIDDCLLIDFPADTYMHVLYGGLDLTKVSSCLITHTHEDHFYPLDFGNRREGFAYLRPDKPFFTVYGSETVGHEMKSVIETVGTARVNFAPLQKFETAVIDGYEVTALAADHDPNSGCVIYMIGDGNKTMLYANDTGYFPEETWTYLIDRTKEGRLRFDYVSIDCTGGLGAQYQRGHMGTEAAASVRERLLNAGCADRDTVFCLHHFSHNGKAIYDELVGPAAEMGFLVSYDGMEVEI